MIKKFYLIVKKYFSFKAHKTSLIIELFMSALLRSLAFLLVPYAASLIVEAATKELKEMGFDKMIIACLKGNPSNEFYKHIGGVYIKDGEYKRLHLPENIYYYDI